MTYPDYENIPYNITYNLKLEHFDEYGMPIYSYVEPSKPKLNIKVMFEQKY